MGTGNTAIVSISNTIDNPGWHVSVGLSETALEGLEIAPRWSARNQTGLASA